MIKVLESKIGKKASLQFMDIQPGDVPKTYADINYSIKKLGFKPKIKIEEGIHNFIKWYKNYKSLEA